MLPLTTFARTLVILGIILVVIGGLLYAFSRAGFLTGKFPGELRIEGQNFTCVIGLGLSIFLSVLLTLCLNLIMRWLNH